MKPYITETTDERKEYLEDIGLDEIIKAIENDLGAIDGLKFIVTEKFFIHSQMIYVNIMESPIRIIRTIGEIPANTGVMNALKDKKLTRKEIAVKQLEKYHYLTQYFTDDPYDESKWCNGVFVTKEGNAIIKTICDIIDNYRWAEEIPCTHGYDQNFDYDLTLGTKTEPFIDGK